MTFLSAWLTRLPTPSLSLAPLSAPAANRIYIKLGRALRSKCVSWLWHPLLIRRIGRALRIGNNLKEGKIATVVQHSAARRTAYPHSPTALTRSSHILPRPSLLAPLPFHRFSVRLLSLLLHMATIFNARYASRCPALRCSALALRACLS